MLTKGLIRARTIADQIRPRFIKTDDGNLLDLAAELIALYKPENDLLRGELEAESDTITRTHRDLKLSKGLNKIMLDQCEFSAIAEEGSAEARKILFTNSAEVLKNGFIETYDDYRNSVLEKSPSLKDFLDKGIYADLPENERLSAVKALFPAELLERYNVSLVQSILFYSGRLEVILEDPEPARMRRLFRYLKFFRLLAKIETITEGTKPKKSSDPSMPAKIKLTIDGPVSIFENTQKYGLQLSSFFPVICELAKWSLEADIKLNANILKLKVDHKSKLKSHYRNPGAYVPEEISIFEKYFREKVTDWEVISELPFVKLPDGELVFPDMGFKRNNSIFGETVHLELFHRWHSTQLMKRLEQCEKSSGLPLLLGVDKYLYKKPEIKAALDASAFFASHGFTFSDFPGVEKVKKMLDSCQP